MRRIRILRFGPGLVVAALMPLWIVSVAAGVRYGIRYETTAAATDRPPASWPLTTRLHRVARQPALVMALHPQCRCSFASLRELRKVLTGSRSHPAVDIIVYKPREVSAEWETSGLVEEARQIPGAQIVIDDMGQESEAFHATVSGEVLLYDSNGVLRFHGGITPARGQEGDSAGLEIIHTFLNGGQPRRPQTPVFGCSLLNAGTAR